MNIRIKELKDDMVVFAWDAVDGASEYSLLWKDRKRTTMLFKENLRTADCECVFKKATHIPYYVKVAACWVGKSPATTAASIGSNDSSVSSSRL